MGKSLGLASVISMALAIIICSTTGGAVFAQPLISPAQTQPAASAPWPARGIFAQPWAGFPTSPVTSMESGQVNDIQLTLSDRVAVPGQPVTVTVTNHSASTIATFNHQSLCSIFSIRKYTQREWSRVLECRLAMPTVPVVIPPGDSKSLTFNDGSRFRGAGALVPGKYRVEFSYKPISDLKDLFSDQIPWQTIHSAGLTIARSRGRTK
jgi:hypothetical protein